MTAPICDGCLTIIIGRLTYAIDQEYALAELIKRPYKHLLPDRDQLCAPSAQPGLLLIPPARLTSLRWTLTLSWARQLLLVFSLVPTLMGLRPHEPPSPEELAADLQYWHRPSRELLDSAGTWLGKELKVHPTNPRYFTDDSGKAVYLTGSHYWYNLQDQMGRPLFSPVLDLLGPQNYTALLDFIQAHGHNHMRMWAWEYSDWEPLPWARIGPNNAKDGQPMFDLSQFNQSYFDRLRQRVTAARDRGIYVQIMFFSRESVIGGDSHTTGPCDYPTTIDPWEYHPFNTANNINGINGDPDGDGCGYETHTMSTHPQIVAVRAVQEALIRKVIDTVNDLDNVLYEISNEDHHVSGSWQHHMIHLVHNYEMGKPARHPVVMTFLFPHNWNGTQQDISELWSSPAEAVSPGNQAYNANPPVASGNKVVIIDTDHLPGNAAIPDNQQTADYSWVWKSFTSGLNPIYMDPIDFSAANYIKSYAQPYSQAILSARAAMGDTLRYATKIGLASMTPSPNLTSTHYSLAHSGQEYLVFNPDPGSFSLTLDANAYSVEWFNPISGQSVQSEIIATGGGSLIFWPPFSGPSVLYLKADGTSVCKLAGRREIRNTIVSDSSRREGRLPVLWRKQIGTSRAAVRF